MLCWNPLTPRKNETDDSMSSGGAVFIFQYLIIQLLIDDLLSGWVALPNMTTARHQPGAVVMDGKLYVAGGYDTATHTFLNSMEVFDDISQRWYPMAAMDTPRAGLQLVAIGGRILAIGGWREREFLTTVEE